MGSGKPAYTVELTPTAEAAYRRIHEEAQPHVAAGRTNHAKVKLLRLVDDCLDNLIPHEPLSSQRALSGKLSNIYRVKKGRLRICYIASSQRLRILVLYIAETPRKEGDKNDPYLLFTTAVESGQFDPFFAKLGVRKQGRKRPEEPTTVR